MQYGEVVTVNFEKKMCLNHALINVSCKLDKVYEHFSEEALQQILGSCADERNT